ncbi:hypothetical protein GGF37_000129 [Kickxella alabastrina]|nr:hypothetical protein GGF37_000129 [Kickxella alabastrina]
MAMATTDSSSTAQNLQQSTPSANGGKELSTNAAQVNDDDEEEAKHRLTAEDLNKLDTSTRVKELLMNPETRALLEAVRKDPSPLEAIRALRQRSDFEELVQALISATGRVD